MTRRTAGASSTEWLRPERHVSSATTAPLSATATDAYLVEVSIASSILRSTERPRPAAPPLSLSNTGRPWLKESTSVSSRPAKARRIRRPSPSNSPPARSAHSTTVTPSPETTSSQTQVGRLGDGLHPVEIDMVQRQPCRVLRHQHERRAASVLSPAKAPQYSLCQAGLAGAQLAFQQDQVTGPGVLANGGPNGLSPLWPVCHYLCEDGISQLRLHLSAGPGLPIVR